MKFNNIYEESIQLWVENIDISDGIFNKETGRFYSEKLSMIWNNADESACNEWQSLMVWIIYQEIHKNAIEYFVKGIQSFKINSVDRLVVRDKYLKALQHKGYEEMLKDYEN